MPDYPFRHGGRENGGTRRFLAEIAKGGLPLWDFTPEFMWECRVGFADLEGPGAVQIATMIIPSVGMTTGALTATFSGGALSSPVAIVAYAAVGEDENDLGDAMEVAVNAAIGSTLAGTVESNENDASSDRLNITMVAGIPLVTVTVAWRSAQQFDLTLSGTLVDADYAVTISGGGLGSPVTSTTTRAGGTPANIGAMIIQVETDLEGLIATTLADVLVSANDDASDTNLLIFEPDIVDVTLATVLSPESIALQFGGTPTDGSYVSTFFHSTLPGVGVEITTVRSTTPSTNADLAVQHEADIEASAQLLSLIATADDDTVDTNIVITHPGVAGLTATTSAPSPGTLTQTPLAWTPAEVTPAGPTVTISYSTTVDLNVRGGTSRGPFPTHVQRLEVAIEVLNAFDSGATITLGDTADPNGLLGSPPVAVDATGRTLSVSGNAEHETQYEGGLVPTATFVLGASNALTQGVIFVQINYAPHPSGTAAAA